MRILILLLSLLLIACSTDQKTLLPVDENTTMLNIWGRQNNDARSALRWCWSGVTTC